MCWCSVHFANWALPVGPRQRRPRTLCFRADALCQPWLQSAPLLFKWGQEKALSAALARSKVVWCSASAVRRTSSRLGACHRLHVALVSVTSAHALAPHPQKLEEECSAALQEAERLRGELAAAQERACAAEVEGAALRAQLAAAQSG
jgi:hypothetical protein